MPRFFFDTKIKETVFEDTEGADFETVEQAVQRSLEDATEFAGNRMSHGDAIDGEEKIIRSEAGEIVARFTIEDAVRKMTKL